MKGGAHPSPFAALSFTNSKKVPLYCWVDRESFPAAAWRSRASNSRDTALTTRPRRLSLRLGTLDKNFSLSCQEVVDSIISSKMGNNVAKQTSVLFRNIPKYIRRYPSAYCTV